MSREKSSRDKSVKTSGTAKAEAKSAAKANAATKPGKAGVIKGGIIAVAPPTFRRERALLKRGVCKF